MKRFCYMLAVLMLLVCCLQPCIAEETVNAVLVLDEDLFLVPIIFEGEEDGYLDAPDPMLHYFPVAAEMKLNGAHLWGEEDMPEGYAPAEEADDRMMHIWTIQNANGEMYVPLFISFEGLFSIFGENVHVGVISYEEAAEMAMTEVVDEVDGVTVTQQCAGIVLAPGVINDIIPLEQLIQEAETQAAPEE